MSATPFDFGRVIAPVTRSDFFAAYYERAPLVIHRNQPDYYADLLDLDTVIAQIETCALKADEIHLVKFGETQNAEDWLGADRRADPIRVLRMVEAGWTVALNKMHLRLPALAKLCQAAEAEFSAAFQTNLYLTPPGAQGFKPHWDTHDVFVLQVHGSKDWVLYDTKVELPLSGQAFESANDTPGPVSRSVTLHAGDILYCQRGLMHAAHSTDETSLHITFGLMAKTWADLMLEAVGGAVLAAPRLRRNLPIGFARPGACSGAGNPCRRASCADLPCCTGGRHVHCQPRHQSA